MFFSCQTNWHARWDVVLLPSLLHCGRLNRLRQSPYVHNMLQGSPPVSLFLAAVRIIAAYGLHQAWRQGLHVQAQDPAQI